MRRVMLALLLLTMSLVVSVGTTVSFAAGKMVSICPTTESDVQGAVAQAGDGGTLRFTCASPRTVQFDREISLARNVTLDGSRSASVTFAGNLRSRLLVVERNATVTIKHLTLRGGGSPDAGRYLAGGAIWNQGHLIVRGSTFTQNRVADGIGGAIASFGKYGDMTLSVANSTFTDNTAGSRACASGGGGAIMAGGASLTVTRSTFAGNQSCQGGGAIFTGAPTTIETSTFVENDGVESGGAIESVADVSISNSTFADNVAFAGAAIHTHQHVVTIGGTIVTGHRFSTAAAGGNCDADFEGSIVDRGYNLEWSGNGRRNIVAPGRSSCFSTANHSILVGAPHLRPLHQNGGPTPTMALSGTSPAIDAIPTSADGLCSPGGTDQRGHPRPDNGETSCDIGAYENQANTALAYTGPRSMPAGRPFTARARLALRNSSGTARPIPNGTPIRFTLGRSTCRGLTLGAIARCVLKSPHRGSNLLRIRFAGSTAYQPSTIAVSVTARPSPGK